MALDKRRMTKLEKAIWELGNRTLEWYEAGVGSGRLRISALDSSEGEELIRQAYETYLLFVEDMNNKQMRKQGGK